MYRTCQLGTACLWLVTLAGMWVWFAGARAGRAEANDGVDGDRIQMGDVTENGAGDDENGETGNAMLDIIWGEEILLKHLKIIRNCEGNDPEHSTHICHKQQVDGSDYP